MRDAHPDDHQLAEYLTGEITPSRRAQIAQWVAEDPERARRVTQLEQARDFVRAREQRHLDAEAHQAGEALAEWARQHPNTTNTTSASARPNATGFRRASSARLWIAGLALGAVGLFAVLWGHTPQRSESSIYHTASGQRSTVRLADGSMMQLAPVTTVTVTAQGLDVTGEVYVTAAPRADRALIVRTSRAVVHVLGTRFSVRQYPDESRSRVVVDDGRVAVSAKETAPTVLSARTLAFVSDSGVAVSSGIATHEYTSWTDGTLVFRGVPLGDLAKELGRAYGVDLRVDDTTLANRRIRMDVVVAEQPLREVLTLLCDVAESHYLEQGRTYRLIPGRKASTRRAIPSRTLSPHQESVYGR